MEEEKPKAPFNRGVIIKPYVDDDLEYIKKLKAQLEIEALDAEKAVKLAAKEKEI